MNGRSFTSGIILIHRGMLRYTRVHTVRLQKILVHQRIWHSIYILINFVRVSN